MSASQDFPLRVSSVPAVRRAGGVVAVAMSLAACGDAGVLDPKGPVAAAERLILINAAGIMLVVVVPVVVLTLGFAWWYRASNARAAYWPDWAYSGQVELVVWSIPAMVVLLLAGVGWIGSHQLDPGAPITVEGGAAKVRIQVVSLDWKWLFIYPGRGVATVSDLHLPTETPIEFVLTSSTVMNAFFVPQLGTQIYTMPGMVTRLNLLAARPGDYFGLSSHFSGDGFSDMRFAVHAVAPAEFDAWVATMRSQATPLTAAAYETLADPHTGSAPIVYGQVDDGLFDRILRMSTRTGPQADAKEWEDPSRPGSETAPAADGRP